MRNVHDLAIHPAQPITHQSQEFEEGSIPYSEPKRGFSRDISERPFSRSTQALPRLILADRLLADWLKGRLKTWGVALVSALGAGRREGSTRP